MIRIDFYGIGTKLGGNSPENYLPDSQHRITFGARKWVKRAGSRKKVSSSGRTASKISGTDLRINVRIAFASSRCPAHVRSRCSSENSSSFIGTKLWRKTATAGRTRNGSAGRALDPCSVLDRVGRVAGALAEATRDLSHEVKDRDINSYANFLNIFKTGKGQIHPFPPAGILIVTDYASSIARLEWLLGQISQTPRK